MSHLAGPASVKDFLDEYELASLLDPTLHEMEQKFQDLHLFKYYSKHRRDFFCAPRIRFTQKTSLNDRFELTKRWNEFGSPPVRAYLTAATKKSLSQKLDNQDFIRNRLLEEFANQGITLSPEQRDVVLRELSSSKGEALIAQLKAQAKESIESLANLFFDQLTLHADAFIEEQTRELGIFSVSETPTNEQLWALYADEGRGFVVTFNVTHVFFKTGKTGLTTWPLFHKVTYTDDRIDDFWRNPLYLFAVKKTRWSFEEEWRMIKSRTECDEVISLSGEDVFLCNVVPGMVESIVFGYAYDEANLEHDMNMFAKFDPTVRFKKATIDHERGCISIVPIRADEGCTA